MHKLSKRLPFLFKLQITLLAGAMFATTVVVNLAAPQGYERVAFAIPAAEHVNRPWRAEVEDFGEKVSRAFGVRPSTANEFAKWILEASQRQGLDPELQSSAHGKSARWRVPMWGPSGRLRSAPSTGVDSAAVPT